MNNPTFFLGAPSLQYPPSPTHDSVGDGNPSQSRSGHSVHLSSNKSSPLFLGSPCLQHPPCPTHGCIGAKPAFQHWIGFFFGSSSYAVFLEVVNFSWAFFSAADTSWLKKATTTRLPAVSSHMLSAAAQPSSVIPRRTTYPGSLRQGKDRHTRNLKFQRTVLSLFESSCGASAGTL